MPLNALPSDPVSLTVKKLCAELQVKLENGLTDDEALIRSEHFGLNELPTSPPTPFWKLVLGQFNDVLVRILLMAATVSFIMAIFEQNFADFVDPFIILLILTFNAIVGVWQERRAEDSINALKRFVPITAVVIRDGKRKTIRAELLVPGDIVEVKVGDRVPADIRVVEIQSTTLRVDQSILTGESEEVIKQTEEICSYSERFPANMIFSGTAIVYGKAYGVVVKTGSTTEIGLIEENVREQEDVKTPLQRKLDEFGVLLSKVISYICLVVFVVNMFHWFYHHENNDNEVWYERYVQPTVHCLKVAVALAVAAIPEGLPAVVTTCLALGTRRMSRCNAFVRDLPSVETLGRCTVICSDKTGTLTTNCMSVVEVATAGLHSKTLNVYKIEDSKYDIITNSITSDRAPSIKPLACNAALDMLSTVAVLCNESSLYRNPDGNTEKIGESTEAALLVMCEKLIQASAETPNCSLPLNEFLVSKQKLWDKQATLEFTRTRKSMSVCCASKSNPKINNLFVKGAPEEILRRSSQVMLANGEIVPIDEVMLDNIVKQTKLMSSSEKALRCIGFAFSPCLPVKELKLSNPDNFEAIESDLIFLGVCGMLDPPREEVPEAILKCHSAGIRVIVITGDKKETAEAMCRKIGLLKKEDTSLLSYTGHEFDKMSSVEKRKAVQNAVVFSRTDPSHKMQLIKLLQEQKLICAMTGDGVNDSPALKCAEIGIAMGSGTEVAKATSQLILADDNFATIVKAVQEGRTIFNNTKQFIRYLISSNIGEVACVLATGILGLPEALSPIQLLWVNLVTDGLPATMLGFNAPEPDIMEHPPRNVDEPIVNGWLFLRYMVIGVYIGLATVAGFLWWFSYNSFTWSELTSFTTCANMTSAKCVVLENPEAARSVALSILVLIEMLNALNAVSENQSIMICRPTSNIWLLFAIASSIVLHLMVMYVPFFAKLFRITPLGVDPTYVQSAKPWSILIPTSFTEWKVVLVLSIPIIFIDEILKFISQRSTRAESKMSSKKKN
ncbi:unnamed protein product [Phytomonas sp. Hart1]|nr:unnamed protein product [Phytomonas sp. Hart1]|eukprot:CCW66645.1 unnamed protein product [Phytomonas sp. isolate Hart1]